MKNLPILTLLNNIYMFNILDSIKVKLVITENPFNLKIDDLFTMAARVNKKRSFLFVSKVLGKHIPIDPNKGIVTGELLASRFVEKIKAIRCPETEALNTLIFNTESAVVSVPFISAAINPIIIGFAETATALGHSFFSCFENADYFHTTREILPNRNPVITFEEEHSHATSHRCYIHTEMLANNREIILVDDEMTTGKTAINIIRSLHAQFPRSQYTVVSILDWRSQEDRQAFSELEKELCIKIHEVCLLAGTVEVEQKQGILEIFNEQEQYNEKGGSVETISLSDFFDQTGSYIKETGRFGMTSKENKTLNEKIAEAAAILRQKRAGTNTLCLGTGELMYIPMRIAAEMGRGVSFHSTTRSPIYIQDAAGYGARYGAAFPSPEDSSVTHYVYNIPPNFYDEIFIFFEKEPEYHQIVPLLNIFNKWGYGSIKLVFLTKR